MEYEKVQLNEITTEMPLACERSRPVKKISPHLKTKWRIEMIHVFLKVVLCVELNNVSQEIKLHCPALLSNYFM